MNKFNSAKEYSEFLKQEKIDKYKARNKFQICVDIAMIVDEISYELQGIQFEGCGGNRVDNMFKQKERLDKEFEILRRKLWKI